MYKITGKVLFVTADITFFLIALAVTMPKGLVDPHNCPGVINRNLKIYHVATEFCNRNDIGR